ncbi:MAG: hypothetical protein Q9193_000208 [Seirophora villosa]
MEVAFAASIVTLVHITEEVGKLCGNYIHGVRHARKDIKRLQLKAEALHGVLTRLNNNPHANIDSEAVQNCCENLKSIKERLQPRRRHVAMQRIGLRALEWPFTSEEIEGHIYALEKYVDLFGTTITLDVHDKTSDAEQDRLLDKLAYAGDALFNSYENEQRHRMCLENTRVEVLQEAMEWATDDSSRCIFWLKGLAGTGKSTIANTVAFRLKAGTRPVATFFFKRGHGDLAHVRKLIPTIARQLSIASPLYKQAIVTVIKKEPDLGLFANFREQYEKLLVEPLRGLLHPTHDRLQFYIIMDALDECEEQRNLRMLLNLMAKTDDLPQLGLKILVTSRPELSIRHGFEEIPTIFHRNLALEDVPRSVVDRDIRTYLSQILKDVQRDFNLPADWPAEQDLDTLASKAGGLFIFAATACRYVGGSPQARPDSRLKQICETVAPNKLMTEELDQMYTIILQNSSKGRYTPEERKDAEERFRHIVGAIVLLLSPLPIVQLFNLLKCRQIQSQAELEGTLRTLHAVIHVPNDSNAPIQPLHLSFRDFLLDPNRCFDRHFWVEERDVHRNLVADCLRLLSSSLSRNICSLPSPGTLKLEVDPATVEAALSPAIQYACRHWAEHARKGEMAVNDHGIVHEFLKTHLLDWLKCMSLMGMITEAISSLLKIVDLTNVSEYIPIPSRVLLTATSQLQEAPLAYDFIEDCHRFTLAFRRPIEQAPEQVYVSALVFSPSRSIVRQNFSHEMPQWLRLAMALPENWGRSLQTIHCRYDPDAITFLHHGELLATSGGYNNSLLDIWDPRTGDCQSSSLPPGDMHFRSLSPDGSLVLSVSYEEVLTIWDVAKRENRFAWEASPSRITATTFSFDSHLVALGYEDGSVRVLSTQTGTDHWNRRMYSESVTDLVFSPDGTMIAIGAVDERIPLWHVQSGSHHLTIEHHLPPRDDAKDFGKDVVMFSPDSKLILTSTDDGVVQLWDSTTGKCRFNLKGHSRRVVKAKFSSNGELLATGSNPFDVFIWNLQTGTCLSGFPQSCGMDISADGTMLALGSFNSVRVWDIAKRTYSARLDGHTSFVTAVCFSPDGNFLASGSKDRTVRVWKMGSMPSDDYSANLRLEPASEDTDERVDIDTVTFSPDGEFVASNSRDTIRIWQPDTGECCSRYKGHSPSFSSDGHIVISASKDGLRLFDVGAKKSHCSPTNNDACNPILSPDGRLAASASMDNHSIQIWDIQEDTTISIPSTNYGRIAQFSFSPTSDLIAYISSDRKAHICDARTGESITVLSLGFFQFSEPPIAFSPNSELLAYGCTDVHYLQLWDIRAGSCRINLGPKNLRSIHALDITFSPEGPMVAASFQGVEEYVRLWNTETGDLLLTIRYFSLRPRFDFLTGMNVLFIDGIGHEIDHPSESPAPAIADRSHLLSDLQLSRWGKWVTRSSKRVLWLPPERIPFPRTYAVWRNKIAIASRTGLMTLLTFDDEPNLPGIEELSLDE